MTRLLGYGMVPTTEDMAPLDGLIEGGIFQSRLWRWWRRIIGSSYALDHHVLGTDRRGLMGSVHPSCIGTAVDAGVHQLRRCIKCGNYMVPEHETRPCANRWLWYPEPPGGWPV